MPFSPSAPACDPCWSIKAPVQFSLTRPSDVTTVDGTTRIVDGVSYFQITDTSYDIGASPTSSSFTPMALAKGST